MKAITFLGIGSYQPITYEWQQQRCQTDLFPVALAHFFKPDALLVVTTAAARAKWWNELERQLTGSVSLTSIDIPDGHSEAELWTIFTHITTHLKERDEVIFDITHSFRTLPFLSFLAAAYLKVARRVELKGIYYGAYDARVPNNRANESGDVAPVFDLTPFVELLDWSEATERFLQTMDARHLGSLLDKTQRRAHLTNPDAPLQPTALQPAARALASASRAIDLAQPGRLTEEAPRLIEKLEKARDDVVTYAPPFAVLLDRVIEGYRPFSMEATADPFSAVKTQWRALLGYFRREQIVQASTLAREWLVTLLCWQLGEHIHDRTSREPLERALNAFSDGRSCTDARELQLKNALVHVPQIHDIARSWSQIRDLRNQIAHCGMTSQDMPPDTLTRNVLSLRNPLQEIASQFNLTEL